MRLLIVTAAAVAATILAQFPTLPIIPSFPTRESFTNIADKAAAIQRLKQSIGQDKHQELEDKKDKMLSAVSNVGTTQPDLRPEVLEGNKKMEPFITGRVFHEPSIADINKPISEYLYGMDIMLTNEEANSMTGNGQGRKKRGAPMISVDRWDKSKPIGFVFQSDIDEPTRVLIREVIATISSQVCVNFKENGTDTIQLSYHRGGGCWSYIGNAMKGGQTQQQISIDMGCENRGIIAHETSHALGLHHTQTRKDRDSSVTINLGAINMTNAENFKQLTDRENDNFGVPYEYGSDMHYGPYDFSINGQAVIIPSDPAYTNSMGQRKGLTFNDVKLLNLLYNCSEACPQKMSCQNGGYQSSRDCSKCVCPNFFTGNLCESTPVTLTISPSVNGRTLFNQAYDSASYGKELNNFRLFPKDFNKIIFAPEGKRIKVTIVQLYAAYGQLACYALCPYVGIEFVDTPNRDLTSMGKTFCCKSDQGYSFVTRSNIVGYRSYASPGMPFDANVLYEVVD